MSIEFCAILKSSSQETIDSSFDLCTIFFCCKTVKKLGKVTVLQQKIKIT